jgi:three-Cys-motif partner protein
MNQFGGNWTEQKIEIVVDYAKAYLTIMNKYPQFKTLYFDGFAGSGNIKKESNNEIEIIKGAALRILEIDKPEPFSRYYFVEKEKKNKIELEKIIKENFPDRIVNVVCEDCNNKIIAMAKFLKENKNYRVLSFVDPYGMAVNWSSIEALKGLGIDLWILVPTGIGVNRLLKKNGDISEAWLIKLQTFLGVSKEEILQVFYKKFKQMHLFDNTSTLIKEEDAIHRIHKLYEQRLKTVFKKISEPFILRNSSNSIMFHFMMATNNAAALNIANDVVKKYKL